MVPEIQIRHEGRKKKEETAGIKGLPEDKGKLTGKEANKVMQVRGK